MGHTKAMDCSRGWIPGTTIAMRYGGAVAFVGVTTLLRWILDPLLGSGSPFLLSLPAVILAGWFGGMGPGLLATVVSAAVGAYLWIDPRGSISMAATHDLIQTLVFILTGVGVSLMGRLLASTAEAARAAEKAKDNFIAVLSHELRNPLAPILAAISVLDNNPEVPVSLHFDLEMIRRNVNLQARLIDDLLDVSRIVNGKLHMRLQPCDVHQCIAHAVEICREDITSRRIQLTFELSAQASYVNGDPARLQQVMWNLLRNSAKFTPAGGRIRVRTFTLGQQIQITVSDNGAGIEPSALRRVFGAFEQESRHDHRQFGGLGLGLAICKGVVEQHFGTIAASSAGLGKGAVFSVVLPLIPAPERPATRPVPAAPQRPRQLRILVVEDHPDTLSLMARLLQREGHAVATAATVLAATTIGQHETFDLLVSDLGLPDGTGHEVMRTLRNISAIKGICLSGFGSDHDIKASAEAGFALHLTKPIDFRTLLQTISELSFEERSAGVPASELATTTLRP